MSVPFFTVIHTNNRGSAIFILPFILNLGQDSLFFIWEMFFLNAVWAYVSVKADQES